MLITDDDARVLIYQTFLEEWFPISLIKEVHRNCFSPPWETVFIDEDGLIDKPAELFDEQPDYEFETAISA